MAAIALVSPSCVYPPPGNDNDPSANKNDNAPKANENDNDIDNGNDNVVDPPPGSEENPLPPEPKRFTIQSQCGQLVIQCTVNYPGPMIEIIPMEGQQVFAAEGDDFVIEGVGDEGIQAIQLAGINTNPGTEANVVRYQWSYGASDFDPCSLEPGPEFSVEENPLVHLEPGFHYIRLTVVNDIQQASVSTARCGTLPSAPSADFLEIEIEVRP
jgi:hypothetical protein